MFSACWRNTLELQTISGCIRHSCGSIRLSLKIQPFNPKSLRVLSACRQKCGSSKESAAYAPSLGDVRLRDSRYSSPRIEAKELFTGCSAVHILRLRGQSGSFCMTAAQGREHAIVGDKLVRLTAAASSLLARSATSGLNSYSCPASVWPIVDGGHGAIIIICSP